jgi:MoaA/NifB/PqqE/SkfB family radical SAM enzyme/predicted SAM-dependent methyltransferase
MANFSHNNDCPHFNFHQKLFFKPFFNLCPRHSSCLLQNAECTNLSIGLLMEKLKGVNSIKEGGKIIISNTSNRSVKKLENFTINSDPNKISTEIACIQDMIATQNFEEAERNCFNILEKNDRDVAALLYLGEINFLQDKIFASEAIFENILSFDPSNAQALKFLVKTNISKQSFEKALKYFTDYCLQYPAGKDIQQFSDILSQSLQGKNLKQLKRIVEFNNLVPNTFTIETALACDLKCPECAIGGNMISSRAKGYMSLENFKSTFDKIKPYCEYLYLHLWGEPLLNKQIFEMIKYASRYTRTNISTNGQSLTDEKIERLVASGVHDVILSIDGFTQEVYEKYRVGGDVSKALNGLKKLAEVNKREGNKIQITPQFIVFKHNEHEIEQFRTFCASLNLNPLFKAPYIRNNDSKFSFSSNPNYVRPQFLDEQSLKNAMSDCINPKEVFTINIDGSVIICCHDYDKKTNFGNIFKQSVEEIWDSPEYRQFRWNILDGKTPDFCLNECMTYTKSDALNSNQLGGEKYDKKNNSFSEEVIKINLCSGPRKIDGYINIDITPNSDLVLDLEENLLPFEDNSVDQLICMSAINYFSRERAIEIIKDVYRVLKTGGIVRFGVQDLQLLAKKYLEKDEKFFFEKLDNGQDRFPGDTFADKFNEWFYGFPSLGKHCKYVYDYNSLAFLFNKSGFDVIEQREYLDSRLDEVELIDNRPEQMFFLEAIKNGFDKITIKELSSENSNQQISSHKEKEWQSILVSLEKDISNNELIIRAASLMIENERWDHLILLLQDYLKVNPNNDDVRELFSKVYKKGQELNPSQEEVIERQNESRKLNLLNSKCESDEFHLDLAINWLCKAFSATGEKGVSANFDLLRNKWNVAYPETTGYIIPTFLQYYKITGNEKYKNYAIAMGDWEKSIQWPNGGIGEPVGVYGLKPRIFNTSQVMLGFLSLFEEIENEDYLNAAEKAAIWIVNNNEDDGNWTKNTYRGPRSYHIRTAWALLELYKFNKDELVYSTALKNINYTLKLAEENGFFRNTSLDDIARPWTHLIGYTLVGLLEIYRLLENDFLKHEIINLLTKSAVNISEYYNTNRESQGYPCFPGTFDKHWQSADDWSCVTGNAQLEFFLRKMGNTINNPNFVECADKVLVDLKSTHMINPNFKNTELFGSLTGSYPVEGKYCSFNLPNWGVKFFADSLIQKMKNINDKYLG